ncbi:hypothetical protein HOK021_38680 [Streptomyces hygroscopicus]|nr:hypothetical protein HOK021_38680 [Streptomyces hygroscopicus]
MNDAAAGGQWMPAQVGVTGNRTGDEPGRGVEPEGSGDDAFGQFQAGQIGVGGRVSVQDGVGLGVQPLLDLGVVGQQVQGPGQGTGRRLRPGQEDGEDRAAVRVDRGLGRVFRITPGPRRPARHLAALSHHPSTPSTRVMLRLAMHRTGRRGLIRADPKDTP